jgi:signal transduction histidine kinase
MRNILARYHVGRPALRAQLTVLYAGLVICVVAAVLLVTGVFLHFGSTSSSAGSAAGSAAAAAGNAAAAAPPASGPQVHVVLAVIGVAVVVAALALSWWIAGRFLRPLQAMTATAKEISASNLHRRLNLNGPDDELTRLGRTLDDLFGRLDASFASQRRFVANASHELRTPLAGQRTLLEVALADPKASAADLRAACEEALALEEHQERLIGALLTLASSEGGVEHRESVDLAALAEHVVMMRADEAHRRGVRVQVSSGTARLAGDPDLLESLVANLVENGLRHNVAGGSLQAVTETRAGQAAVSVTNTGPMVSAEDVDRLFEPFRRAGSDRTRTGEGHGLGLSIVRAVADAHGATLTIEPQTGGGLRVEVLFPAAGPRAE